MPSMTGIHIFGGSTAEPLSSGRTTRAPSFMRGVKPGAGVFTSGSGSLTAGVFCFGVAGAGLASLATATACG